MRLPRSSRGSVLQVQMTPMIDVVFLLLVFFLWTSSFEKPEYDLPSALAEPPAGLADQQETPPPPEAFDELIIVVRQEGGAMEMTLNGNPVPDLGSLQRQLREIVQLGVQPPVVVDPSPETTMRTSIQIYDIARSAGLDRVLFAADAP